MKIHNAIRWTDNLYVFNYRSVLSEPVEYFHAHEGLEVLYIHEATGEYIINNRQFTLQPRTLILVKPFQIHRIKVNAPPDYVRTLLKIKSSVVDSFLAALPQLASALSQFMDHDLPYQLFYLTPKDGNYMENEFSQLYETLTVVQPMLRKEVVTLFLFYFFTYFNSHIYPQQPSPSLTHPPSASTTEFIGTMVKWIDKHYHLSFTVTDMAADLHFSPNYLSKLFKEQMDMTIVEYTNAKRLEEARTLLAVPSLTIEEISKVTGFNYPSYFIAMFKKKYGMTPHRYRMRMK
ncbi:AraC family transcriptional regulator [Paenibacillus sp. SAF-054]|uniref:AraC family transcriptional regulator n=1 Tax=Paenibacillus sp. SAF-054 TaxID=3436863 RepID=UPI003F7E44E1